MNINNMEYVKLNLVDYKDILFRNELHKDEIQEMQGKINKILADETVTIYGGFLSYKGTTFYSKSDSIQELMKEIENRDKLIKSLEKFNDNIKDKWWFKIFKKCI